MKTKITRFLLMTSFLISAISCSVDEQEPSASNLPTPVDAGSVAPGAYEYTPGEVTLLKQSLVGIYKDRRSKHSIFITKKVFQFYRVLPKPSVCFGTSQYTVSFSKFTRPIINLDNGEKGAYHIIRAKNSLTKVIGLQNNNGVQYFKQ